MKTIIVLAIICTLTLQQTVLVASSASNTLVTFPSSATINLEPYHNANNPNFIGYGAQWVWQASGSSWPNNYINSFQSNFYASCDGAATLVITADNVFSASINGGPAMGGSDWTKPQKFDIKVNCGFNTLTVNVTNKDQSSPAALIFAVVQDPSVCPKCTGLFSYYDVNSCSCRCIQSCSCTALNSLYMWYDYPTCGCMCAKSLICPANQYFNANTCTCQCKPVSCLPGFYQDPKTCECVRRCVDTGCPRGMVWSASQCKCVCAVSPLCIYPYVANANCGCSCPASNPNCNILAATAGTIPV